MRLVDDAAPSPWLVDPPQATPALQADCEADVAIVGAGFTGLSSALALRREGLDVVVLEAKTAGFGASGRNAGHLTPTIGKDLPTLCLMYGQPRVRGLLALAELSIDHVEGLIARHAIDCDYDATGNVIAAVCPRQWAVVDRAAQAASLHGLKGELLDAAAMRRRGLPAAFSRGYLEPHGGVLHPGKYVRGLRQAALAAGARLYENTPVTQIEDDAPAQVVTPRARVRCRHVVIASNAWTPELGLLRSSGLRIQVQLFQTAPLTPSQRDRLGWPGREGIYTAHEILESYRLTRDDRIVGGSKHIRAGFGRRTLPDTTQAVSRRLEEMFRARFPELADVAIDRHWGGPIFMSLDFLPWVGRSGKHGNLLHSIAYAGHGIAQASYAGEMLADLLLEREGPGAALWSRRRVPMPPEPLRWLAYQGLVRYFAARDRRDDRAAVR